MLPVRLQPVEAEGVKVDAAPPVADELGYRLADTCGVLEAVSRTGGHDGDPLPVGVAVDDEAGVRRHGVEAGGGPDSAGPGAPKPACDMGGVHRRALAGRHVAIDAVGVAGQTVLLGRTLTAAAPGRAGKP